MTEVQWLWIVISFQWVAVFFMITWVFRAIEHVKRADSVIRKCFSISTPGEEVTFARVDVLKGDENE